MMGGRLGKELRLAFIADRDALGSERDWWGMSVICNAVKDDTPILTASSRTLSEWWQITDRNARLRRARLVAAGFLVPLNEGNTGGRQRTNQYLVNPVGHATTFSAEETRSLAALNPVVTGRKPGRLADHQGNKETRRGRGRAKTTNDDRSDRPQIARCSVHGTPLEQTADGELRCAYCDNANVEALA
jgi:hypothetical protein